MNISFFGYDLKIFDIPGISDPEKNLSNWIDQLKLKISGNKIDVILFCL